MMLEEMRRYADLYRTALLQDVVPFWMKHSLDREHGGYLTCLDRDGSVYGTDKGIWMQARQVWMLSKLCIEVEARDEWREAASLGYDFLRRCGFDSDGRMYYSVTRAGLPLRKRRYVFSEAFTVIAFAEYARMTGDREALEHARDVYRMMLRYYRTPGMLEPKVYPETRPMKSLAMPMILLATTGELRLSGDSPLYEDVIDDALFQILEHFLQPELRALLETVGPAGERIDGPAGRCVNPGHSVEAAWFLLEEARHRNDEAIAASAVDILSWSLERGWDNEYGGLFAFVDIENKPSDRLEWDMKFWWPHTEALYAALLAYKVTGDTAFENWFRRIHEYAFAHFPDPEHGEWFAYLHRDGTVGNSLKGSLWKGMFHIPRALWFCARLLDEMIQDEGGGLQ